MFLKRFLFPAFLLCFVLGCNESDNMDCSLVDCLSVDNSIYFKILDKTSGENLITNGTYQASQINIVDSNTNAVNFEFQKDFENQDVLFIDVQNETFGDIGYGIRLGDMSPFNFTLTTSFIQGNECCGPYTGTNDTSLSGIEGEFENDRTLPLWVTVFVP